MALEYFKVSYFTSYSEITLDASTISLVIEKQHSLPGMTFSFLSYQRKISCKEIQKIDAQSWEASVALLTDIVNVAFVLFLEQFSSVREEMAKSMIPKTTDAPNQMLLNIHLYTSPDYSFPLDPLTRLQTNKRIYALVRIFVYDFSDDPNHSILQATFSHSCHVLFFYFNSCVLQIHSQIN